MHGCPPVLPFHPEPDLVEARATIRQAVNAVLAKLQTGVLPDDAELEHVDIKEEAGAEAVVESYRPDRPRTRRLPLNWPTRSPASPTPPAAEH